MVKKIALYVIIALVVLACDENGGDYVLNPNNIAGEIISQEVTLGDTTDTYYLNGELIVGYGGTLNIKPGTKIIVKGGTPSYIAVERGGKIYADGDPDGDGGSDPKPIVFTSDMKTAGSWGGLVICGKAPTNLMDETGDFVQAEVTGLNYGGDDGGDNSGIISYVRVEYSGYSYNDDKQFNGFSFFGVGRGTTVDHICSYSSDDDGVEFFGGNVNAYYVASINSNDDGIDFTDGWQGNGAYWYSYNSAKSGIEGSNNASDGNADPITTFHLSNATVYKMGERPWYLKEGSGTQIVDNLIIGGMADNAGYPYFYYEKNDIYTIARVAKDKIQFDNVRFINRGEGNDTDASGSIDIIKNDNAIGAGTWADGDTTLAPSWLEGWSYPED